MFGAEVLAALRFATWPAVGAGDYGVASAATSVQRSQQSPRPQPTAARSNSSDSSHDTYEEPGEGRCPLLDRWLPADVPQLLPQVPVRQHLYGLVTPITDVECRPRKVRVLSTASSLVASAALARRSYVWRGAARKAHQPVGDCTSASVAPADATPAATETNDGNKEWAALTTWLRMVRARPRPLCHALLLPPSSCATRAAGARARAHDARAPVQNIHHPRTAKRVVMFLGSRDPGSGRWFFVLNPALRWADLSLDTRLRLAGLVQEARGAFARKYPSRPPDQWRQKSQKYKPPGQAATHTVALGDLVTSLQAVADRFLAEEGVAGDARQMSPDSGANSGSWPAHTPALEHEARAAATAATAAASHTSSAATTVDAMGAEHLSARLAE